MLCVQTIGPKLPLLSKILEKALANQLTAVLEKHNVFDKFQLGFWKQQSTETVVLRLFLLLETQSSDRVECSVLVLLDLSSDRLTSYLSDRSFTASIGVFVSDSSPLSCPPGLSSGAPVILCK